MGSPPLISSTAVESFCNRCLLDLGVARFADLIPALFLRRLAHFFGFPRFLLLFFFGHVFQLL